ncbi:hypothetical protein BaRGS_00032449 [Batillaria attramentaria]|uniref:Uncharacterized protein n=1 Tax=Batillaria attramentaria TaxID=370345 RepID=A0ABD0JMZ7_9CAEN
MRDNTAVLRLAGFGSGTQGWRPQATFSLPDGFQKQRTGVVYAKLLAENQWEDLTSVKDLPILDLKKLSVHSGGEFFFERRAKAKKILDSCYKRQL